MNNIKNYLFISSFVLCNIWEHLITDHFYPRVFMLLIIISYASDLIMDIIKWTKTFKNE